MLPRPARCAAFFAVLISLSAVILTPLPVLAQRFITIDPPGSTSTVVQAINDLGQMVGDYTDIYGVHHGFLLTAGVYTVVDFPGAVGTYPGGINNGGQIVGFYSDSDHLYHGFVLSNGTFTSFDDPAFAGATFAAQIDDLGQIVGYGVDGQGVVHGFLLSNGVFTTIDFPSSNSTFILDINFEGSTIVGGYSTPSFPAGATQGFMDIDGQFTTITFPGSFSTQVTGVNNGNQTVGTYSFSAQGNPFHAFFLSGGNFSIVDMPGALSTGTSNLNDLGQLVGQYIDTGNVAHGYLMTSGPFAYVPIRATNSVSVFDVPTGLRAGTIPVDSGPIAIGLSPDGTSAYVTNYDGNSVSAVDTTTLTSTAIIPVGLAPLGVAVTPNGSFAYVANNFSASVSVINTSSNSVVATVPVGSIPSFVAITPDGNSVYVTNQFSNNVSVISTATNTVTATVPVGNNPVGVAITPNGQFAYVTNAGSNTVSVISTTTDPPSVVATIPVGAAPVRVSITPDGTSAYVSNQNSGNVVSVIDIPSNTVVANVAVGTTPYGSASTSDGAFVWVVDAGSGQISMISTATNTVVGTVPVGGSTDIAIGTGPTTSQSLTQTLSPTQPNVFDFGTHDQQVQYPPGTSFSNVNMTTTAVEITPAQFKQQVAGTEFASASCIVYAGNGGNCVEYQVTCSDNDGNAISCPSEATPTIGVQTSFNTQQSIVNPGYLTTPLPAPPFQWQNIFSSLTDPTVKGKTKGFSEFVAVTLGSGSNKGVGNFQILKPFRPQDSRIFTQGTLRAVVKFLLTSKAGSPITDAKAGLSVEMIADANGHHRSKVVLSNPNAFRLHDASRGLYGYYLCLHPYPKGTYRMTIYGNAFASVQILFTVN